MDEYAASKLVVVETIDGTDKIDWEKFNSGDYVLATRWSTDGKNFENIVEPGDKVQIRSHNQKYAETMEEPMESGQTTTYVSYENAPVKEYEVYAVVDIPLAMRYRVDDFIKFCIEYSNIVSADFMKYWHLAKYVDD